MAKPKQFLPIFILFCLSLILTSMKCSDKDLIDAKKKAFCQKWVHSYEEDEDENLVFRNSDYDLPPSRGRVSFEFFEDGKMNFTGISPTDAHQATGGIWEKIGKNIIEVSIDDNKQVMKLEIISLENNKMVIKYVN